MTKRSEQKAATRKLLVRIATAAFARQPYSEVTFRGLARAAGVSTGAYFASWKSKEELYEEVTGRRPPEAVAAHVPEIVDFLTSAAVALAGTEHGALGLKAEMLRAKIVGA
jgi:hypothetical protein